MPPILPRDENGRLQRDPRDGEHPFEELLPDRKRERDGRSGRKQEAAPFQLTLRVPAQLMNRLRTEAQKRDCTVTKIVLVALKNELQLEIQNDFPLRDSVPSMPQFLGQNRKMPRLADERPSTVKSDIPEFDHVNRWRQKQKRQFGGALIDKPGSGR